MYIYNLKKYLFSQNICLWLIFFAPIASYADWDIITHTNLNNALKTQVAYTENKNGYSLEIYKDTVGAVRTRFTLNSSLNLISKEICPTYQVDLTLVKNTSFNLSLIHI